MGAAPASAISVSRNAAMCDMIDSGTMCWFTTKRGRGVEAAPVHARSVTGNGATGATRRRTLGAGASPAPASSVHENVTTHDVSISGATCERRRFTKIVGRGSKAAPAPVSSGSGNGATCKVIRNAGTTGDTRIKSSSVSVKYREQERHQV
jgi:hypothetical protein